MPVDEDTFPVVLHYGVPIRRLADCLGLDHEHARRADQHVIDVVALCWDIVADAIAGTEAP
jgi:hypothetical protein